MAKIWISWKKSNKDKLDVCLVKSKEFVIKLAKIANYEHKLKSVDTFAAFLKKLVKLMHYNAQLLTLDSCYFSPSHAKLTFLARFFVVLFKHVIRSTKKESLDKGMENVSAFQ